MSKSVIFVEKSDNRKTGRVSATYVSQASCPKTCAFRNNGCYAEMGMVGIHSRRLNKSTESNIMSIAKEEAGLIKKASGKYNLRLHVVGDADSDVCAYILSDAADVYMEKNKKKVWTYTHNRTTKRESWGNISVLRSCETVRQAETANQAGFAAAMVVADFKKNTAYPIGRGLVGIPCPAQTKENVTCESCQLCMNADRLQKNKRVILFSAHGSRKGAVKKQLTVLN